MNLRKKVVLSFVVLIVGPFLLVGWYYSARTSEAIKDEVGKTMEQLVQRHHYVLERTIASLNDKTILFLYNQFLSETGNYEYWTSIDDMKQAVNANDFLTRQSFDGTQLSILLEIQQGHPLAAWSTNRPSGLFFVSDFERDLPDWAAATVNANGRVVLQQIEVMGDNPGGRTTVALSRMIIDRYDYDRHQGMLVLTGLETMLSRDLRTVRLPDRSGVFLYNHHRELVLGDDASAFDAPAIPQRIWEEKDGVGYVKEDGEEWLYAYSFLPAFNTKLVFRIPLEAIVGNQSARQQTILVLSAVYLIIVLAYLLYLLRLILQPLGTLVSLAKRYEPGMVPAAKPAMHRKDEVGFLYRSLYDMMIRLNHLIEVNYVVELKAKDTQLMALHSQITPHLLYNTLDSIYWYAFKGGMLEVGDMVKDLSKLLRIGLSRGRDIILLREELEHVRAYIRLQLKRYPNAFEVYWEVDDELLACQVPKVILQPLAENAIFHGISKMDGEGLLWIRCLEEGGELRLIIADNGYIPVDYDMLNRIVRGEQEEKGYGISNVNRRIQLHYGESFGLHYAPREGGGTTAVIRIPLYK